MQIYNLEKRGVEEHTESFDDGMCRLIVAGFDDVERIAKFLGVVPFPRGVYETVDANIKFETNESYDFVSFVTFELENEAFVFEKINVYFARKFILVVVNDTCRLHEAIIGDLKVDHMKTTGEEGLAGIYYRLFNSALSRMLDALSCYEDLLIAMETRLLGGGNIDFERIVEMKSASFQVKKYLRFFLHIGDQIVDNENQLIPKKFLKNFKNIDSRINRLYEFAVSLHEMAEHLMDLYDSSVSTRTNGMINKLTIVTVFATPLSVITGIYGMNFINMPELQNPYAYFVVLGIMATSVGVTYLVLKKNRLL